MPVVGWRTLSAKGLALLAFASLFAGCAAPAAPGEDAAGSPGLVGTTKPVGELTAPRFELLGAIARGWTAATGEPSIAVGPEGSLYVRFYGCDDSPQYLVALVEHDALGNERRNCVHNPVYKSSDDGSSWTLLNEKGTGKLSPEAPTALGDPDIAVDWAGSIYVTDNDAGLIATQRSDDGGMTWTYFGNIAPAGDDPDKPGVAAAGPGHAIYAWWQYDVNRANPGALSIRTTFDGGATFTNVTYLRDNIGWLGKPTFAPDGVKAYVPFTLPIQQGSPTERRPYELRMGATSDGGRTWRDIGTGVVVASDPVPRPVSHPSGMAVAPTIAVTGDGHVVYAYTEQVAGLGGAVNSGIDAKLIHSRDDGATWSQPILLSNLPSAIMPWVSGGAGDRVAVTYLANNLPGDPNHVGRWDVRAAIIDLDQGRMVDALVERDVHLGGLCSGRLPCDPAFREFFQNTILPDGRIAIAYPADPPQGGKYTEIRVAIQDGGSLMLTRGT